MKKSHIGLFLGAATSFSYQLNNEGYNDVIENGKTPKSKIMIIPKGCKKYYFREDGTFVRNTDGRNLLKTEIIFNCVASSDKVAIKKFNKFKSKI